MKKTLLIFAVVVIAACTASKKNSKATASSSASSTPTVNNAIVSPAPTAVMPFPIIKPANGIYAPGNEELKAIQVQFKDVTLAKLQEGHTLYTQSACIQCHEPMNIYVHNETQWKSIIGDMAQRARITDEQRDAVYKYVLAIKAAQVK